jgi:hypothetical protein
MELVISIRLMTKSCNTLTVSMEPQTNSIKGKEHEVSFLMLCATANVLIHDPLLISDSSIK